jgi:hypothetical protein
LALEKANFLWMEKEYLYLPELIEAFAPSTPRKSTKLQSALASIAEY